MEKRVGRTVSVNNGRRRRVQLPKKGGRGRHGRVTKQPRREDAQQRNLQKYTDLPDIIEAWSPKPWTRELPVVRQFFVRKKWSIHSLHQQFGNRSIHCRIREHADHFVCDFVGNGDGAAKSMREAAEKLKDQERAKNQRATGIFETDEERVARENNESIAREFEQDPDKRFRLIRDLGELHNFASVYVIELRETVRDSEFTPAYPSDDHPELSTHGPESRCFYVGTTWHTLEDRYHAGEKNHMWNAAGNPRIGVVRRHRLIDDDHPFTRSMAHLKDLTNRYGWENKGHKDRTRSYQFEHYVAWALYKCGHRTWGPQFIELPGPKQKAEWRGKAPYF